MKLVTEYRRFAEQYRKLSDKLGRPKDKYALALMASAWERLARQREERLVQPISKGNGIGQSEVLQHVSTINIVRVSKLRGFLRGR
jgi:hypothetical protein